MTQKHANITVISLGGSMIAPDLPDPKFVKAFVTLIKARVKKGPGRAGRRFIVVTGGGRTCRNYQNALKAVRPITDDENDWMGIYTTHFNAQFMRLAFGKLAHKEVATKYGKKIAFNTPVLIGGGEVPGHSTDFDAVLLAKMFGAKHIVNISNTNYVYTADPKKDRHAKPLPKLSWNQYLSIIPKKWKPGFSSPFDVKASALAKKYKLTVSIVNGNKLREVAKALDGAKFKGSVIAS
ncbi:UMP kinase [Candidatus Kaiserbacteria bacterium]|nr:UMP kinase [Candidatus Kaiserbacteria bacterium]